MGYLRSLREDEERIVENDRVQKLEAEKMRKEAAALALMAAERKQARLREEAVAKQRQQQQQQQAKPQRNLLVSMPTDNVPETPLPTSLKSRISAKINQLEEEDKAAEEATTEPDEDEESKDA